MRASSAARRNVPSPPSTEHQFAALGGVARRRRRPRSRRRVPRMSSGARCSEPAVDGLRGQHAQPDPVVAQHFLHPARGLGGLVAAGVHAPAGRCVRGSLRPFVDGAAHRVARARRPSAARRGRRAAAGSIRRCPTGRAAGWRSRRRCASPSSAARRATASTASARSAGSRHHAACADPILADLELWLHHGNDIGVRRRARSQRGQHRRQRDERQVGHHEVDGSADRRPASARARWCAPSPSPRIVGPQRPRQLPVTDVDGDHLAGTAVQQHLGEPAGRRARVQAAASVDRRCRRRPARR